MQFLMSDYYISVVYLYGESHLNPFSKQFLEMLLNFPKSAASHICIMHTMPKNDFHCQLIAPSINQLITRIAVSKVNSSALAEA